MILVKYHRILEASTLPAKHQPANFLKTSHSHNYTKIDASHSVFRRKQQNRTCLELYCCTVQLLFFTFLKIVHQVLDKHRIDCEDNIMMHL